MKRQINVRGGLYYNLETLQIIELRLAWSGAFIHSINYFGEMYTEHYLKKDFNRLLKENNFRYLGSL